MLIVFGKDKPGFIGGIGTLLGSKKINIAHMTFGRKAAGGKAITILNVDASLPRDCLREIEQMEHIEAAYPIHL